MAVYYESFDNIYKFMDVLHNRKNNNQFSDRNSSHEEGDWSGTNTYEQAEKEFSEGYPEKVAKMKELSKKVSISTQGVGTKSRTIRHYYGYAPNIPAALAGEPKTMYRRITQRAPMKAISIYYCETASGFTGSGDIEKSGFAVFQLIYMLELSGYRVEFNLLPFVGKSRNGNYATCILRLKNYGDRLDLLKLSFPITCTAMFRRFGFRWIETAPKLPGNASEWGGYGVPVNHDKMVDILKREGHCTNGFVFTFGDVSDNEFDYKKLFDNIQKYKM